MIISLRLSSTSASLFACYWLAQTRDVSTHLMVHWHQAGNSWRHLDCCLASFLEESWKFGQAIMELCVVRSSQWSWRSWQRWRAKLWRSHIRESVQDVINGPFLLAKHVGMMILKQNIGIAWFLLLLECRKEEVARMQSPLPGKRVSYTHISSIICPRLWHVFICRINPCGVCSFVLSYSFFVALVGKTISSPKTQFIALMSQRSKKVPAITNAHEVVVPRV